LELYLSGTLEGFAPPPPFTLAELEAGVVPERVYTKDELQAYLAYTRQKGHRTIGALTDEQARQPIEFLWAQGKAVSFFELQLYNMRHVQEHAAQLSILLGQNAIHAGPSWIARARRDPDTK